MGTCQNDFASKVTKRFLKVKLTESEQRILSVPFSELSRGRFRGTSSSFCPPCLICLVFQFIKPVRPIARFFGDWFSEDSLQLKCSLSSLRSYCFKDDTFRSRVFRVVTLDGGATIFTGQSGRKSRTTFRDGAMMTDQSKNVEDVVEFFSSEGIGEFGEAAKPQIAAFQCENSSKYATYCTVVESWKSTEFMRMVCLKPIRVTCSL